MVAMGRHQEFRRVIVSNANGCTDTAEVKIGVSTKPTAFAGEDKILLFGESVLLEGVASGLDISFYWTPAYFLNDPMALQPLCTAPKDTSYTLHVQSNVGCGSATDLVKVKVIKGIYVPAAFSPNNDGYNDVWRIEALEAFPNSLVPVYNRLDEKMVESAGKKFFWDGRFKGEPQPTGTYVYVIYLKNNKPVLKGTVVLIK
jgi:gliding motility-associated-like protein